MTVNELIEKLQALPEEQRELEAIVFDLYREFGPVTEIAIEGYGTWVYPSGKYVEKTGVLITCD